MERKRDAAVGAFEGAPALPAEHGGSETAAVQQDECLFAPRQRLLQRRRERPADRGLARSARHFRSHVDDLHLRERPAVHPLGHRHSAIATPPRVVKRLQGRRGRTEHHQGAGALRAHDRDAPCVVSGTLLLLVGGIVLFIDDNESQIVQRGEHRRPRAYDHVDLAAPDAMPLIVSRAGRQPAVLYRHAVSERSPEGIRHRRCQRDFRHQHQHPAPRLRNPPGKAQVHLGLAAPRDTVQQSDVKHAFFRQRGQLVEGRPLLGGRFTLQASGGHRIRRLAFVGGKGIPVDAAEIHRHQTPFPETRHRRRGDAVLPQQHRAQSAREAGQSMQRGALLRTDSPRRPGQKRVATGRCKAGHPLRPEPVASPGRRQREWRHCRGQRFARATGVVLRHPERQIDHVSRQVGLRIQGRQQVAQLPGRRRRTRIAIAPAAIGHYAAAHDALAERDAHASSHRRNRHAVRHPVAQCRQRRNRHRHRHDYGHQSPRRMDRTRFMSSHTSRLRSGLRSRKAGWNVGISFAPRHA